MITLAGEYGSYRVRMLGIFNLDGKEYALVSQIDEQAGTATTNSDAGYIDAGNIVVVQLLEQDGEALFRTIESDAEFDRVAAYAQELMRELADSQEQTDRPPRGPDLNRGSA